MNPDPKDTWTTDAIERGDIAAVKQRVVDEASYLASRDFVGDTPLLTAIGFDHVELVQFLLAHGADPNVVVDDSYTCLLAAVEMEHPNSLEIVRLLIKGGADLHVAGINGWTPLHMAASLGRLEKVRLLLENRADVNRRIAIVGEETPLMKAAYSGHPEVVRLLLDYGADATLRETVQNRTPLEIAREAAKGADPKVIESLKNQDIDRDIGALLKDGDLTDEEREILKPCTEELDAAEDYRRSAEELARDGKHEEVIRILARYET